MLRWRVSNGMLRCVVILKCALLGISTNSWCALQTMNESSPEAFSDWQKSWEEEGKHKERKSTNNETFYLLSWPLRIIDGNQSRRLMLLLLLMIKLSKTLRAQHPNMLIVLSSSSRSWAPLSSSLPFSSGSTSSSGMLGLGFWSLGVLIAMVEWERTSIEAVILTGEVSGGRRLGSERRRAADQRAKQRGET